MPGSSKKPCLHSNTKKKFLSLFNVQRKRVLWQERFCFFYCSENASSSSSFNGCWLIAPTGGAEMKHHKIYACTYHYTTRIQMPHGENRVVSISSSMASVIALFLGPLSFGAGKSLLFCAIMQQRYILPPFFVKHL